MARNYVRINDQEEKIQAMREAGKTRQAIADELGLTKVQIKNWINRHNKRVALQAAGKLPARKGRPRLRPRTAEEEKDYELKRLKMENELLRDFLHLAGRR
jgi:predicted transcriptional regulator